MDLLALESQVCFALSLASRGVIAAYRPVLEPLQLTHPQYLVMLALWQYEPLTVKRLGELLSLDPGTLSPLIKRLEANGYVNRRRAPSDERQLEITLTSRGRELRSEAEKIPEIMMQKLGMDSEELLALHQQMTRVIERLKNIEAG